MNESEVCVDAGVAIKVVVPEVGSDKADALFSQWAEQEKRLIAPAFFDVETDSILRQGLTTPRVDRRRGRTCICIAAGIAYYDQPFR